MEINNLFLKMLTVSGCSKLPIADQLHERLRGGYDLCCISDSLLCRPLGMSISPLNPHPFLWPQTTHFNVNSSAPLMHLSSDYTVAVAKA